MLGKAVSALRASAPRTRLLSPDGWNPGNERPVGEVFELLGRLSGGEVDIVMADVSLIPASLGKELCLAGVLKRGNPFDALISESDMILEEYPGEVPIEVCNPVTRSQLLYLRPDLRCLDYGDGFDSSYQRMVLGVTGGFVLPASVVETLNQQDKVAEVFTSSMCMPPAGQGAQGFVTRREDRRSRDLVKKVNHEPTYLEISLERMFLRYMDDDPNTGVLCKIGETGFSLSAARTAPDGSDRVERSLSGEFGDEEAVVRKLADEIMEGTGSDIFSMDIYIGDSGSNG